MKKWMLANWLMPISLAILGANMSACSATAWREEVLLHNGEKIIVERSITRHGRHELGQRPPVGEENIIIHLPESDQVVTWKDEYSEDVGSANFIPMLLDIYQGIPYLIASPMGCLSYNKWGRPNPPYVVFQYHGHEWEKIPLNRLPHEFVIPNLIISSPDDEAKQAGIGVIRAEKVREINMGFKQPQFKTILREPLKRGSIGVDCPELVYYKGGWIGPGDSIGRRMKDRMSK